MSRCPRCLVETPQYSYDVICQACSASASPDSDGVSRFWTVLIGGGLEIVGLLLLLVSPLFGAIAGLLAVAYLATGYFVLTARSATSRVASKVLGIFALVPAIYLVSLLSTGTFAH